MNSGTCVFATLMSFIPRYEFQKCASRCSGDYKSQWFNSRIHFQTMCFAQLTCRESLRDIENSLIALSGRFYHCGIPQPVREFKWIKQHLHIKAFYGTSFNAVCVQIWIAVCVYLLIAIVKRKLKMEQSLYTILQTFSLCFLEKPFLNQLLEKQTCNFNEQDDPNQLLLF